MVIIFLFKKLSVLHQWRHPTQATRKCRQTDIITLLNKRQNVTQCLLCRALAPTLERVRPCFFKCQSFFFNSRRGMLSFSYAALEFQLLYYQMFLLWSRAVIIIFIARFLILYWCCRRDCILVLILKNLSKFCDKCRTESGYVLSSIVIYFNFSNEVAQLATTWLLFSSETWWHYGFASKLRVVMSTFLYVYF